MEEIKITHIDSLASTLSAGSLVVIDENVWNLYRDKLNLSQPIVYKAPAGEKSKNFEEYQKCVDFLIENGATRVSHLVAIGGGAVCDMAGFVASTIYRGISWSVIPTTFLSMVDSCVGGKVAINSLHGKNLIGAFHHPQNIYLCFDFLDSLDKSEIESGKGEILKYCFLSSEIYQAVGSEYKIRDLILACVNYKKRIVDLDFKEKGIRKILNLGHSFGHVLEKKYKLGHGIAVMMGIYYLFLLFDEKENLINFKKLQEKLEISHYQMVPLPSLELLKRDKKVIDENIIQLVRINGIGDPYIDLIPLADLIEKAESL